jgi:hypothetical protein
MRRVKNNILIKILFIMVFCILGCSIFKKGTSEVFFVEEDIFYKTWIINKITIDKAVFIESLEKNVMDILMMLGPKYGFEIIPGYKETDINPGSIFLADIWIKEQEFTKGLKIYNSVTVILILTEPETEKECIRLLFTKDSKESLKSFYYLYSIFEDLFQKVSENNKKNRKDK